MKMAKETWIQGQCQKVEACLRKNNSKKAYQLVKVNMIWYKYTMWAGNIRLMRKNFSKRWHRYAPNVMSCAEQDTVTDLSKILSF